MFSVKLLAGDFAKSLSESEKLDLVKAAKDIPQHPLVHLLIKAIGLKNPRIGPRVASGVKSYANLLLSIHNDNVYKFLETVTSWTSLCKFQGECHLVRVHLRDPGVLLPS